MFNFKIEKMSKKVIATTSLAGCFGCHMSILDIDERIIDLVELVEFNKSPVDDIKNLQKSRYRYCGRRMLQQRKCLKY